MVAHSSEPGSLHYTVRDSCVHHFPLQPPYPWALSRIAQVHLFHYPHLPSKSCPHSIYLRHLWLHLCIQHYPRGLWRCRFLCHILPSWPDHCRVRPAPYLQAAYSASLPVSNHPTISAIQDPPLGQIVPLHHRGWFSLVTRPRLPRQCAGGVDPRWPYL